MITLTDEVRGGLAQLGEALDDGLLLVDQHGAIHLSNRTARALLDVQSDRLGTGGGGPWQSELLALLRRLPSEGSATELHVTGGVPVVLEGYAVEEKGTFWGGVFVARSAAGRQRELDTSRAAEFARDVKNTLHSLLLNLYMLRKWAASQPFVETHTLAKYDLLSNEVHRLNGIAEDFLPDARSPRARRDTVRLPQLLAEVASLVAAQARDAGVDVRCRIPEELPPIQGDARLLREAFVNLVVNRLQAIPERGELEILAGTGGKHAFVMVSDSGPGIPFGLRDQVMTEGFAVRPGAGGRGLGITDWVVRGHGGTFETFSAAGLGTTFVVKLPLSGVPPGFTGEDLGLLRQA
jgi:signal transduction histidine kinase